MDDLPVDARRTRTRGLPTPPSALLGRDDTLRRAVEDLGRVRVLTVVGPGGVGKTRFALELARSIADRFADGARFVSFAPLGAPAEVIPAIARALGLRDGGSEPVAATVRRYLAAREMLLVLDNMEHLPAAAEDIAELVAHTGDVRIVVTSRVSLRMPGEQQVVLEPLPVAGTDAATPTEPAELEDVAGTKLFLERVRAADPTFVLPAGGAAMVAEICRRLDGLPLALELAAARVRAYGLDDVRAGLCDRFALLELPHRPGPDRHRALRAAVHWSVELLEHRARELFARLAVFAGGWNADAACQVCGEEGDDVRRTLAELVDHSLVVPEPTTTGMRYRMLETLREYAAELLTPDDRARLDGRLLSWCEDLADAVTAEPYGEHELMRTARAEVELDNVRAALERAGPTLTAEALRTAGSLYRLWDTRGHLSEGCRHLRRLLDRPASYESPAERALALDTLAMLTLWQDDHAATRSALAESIDLSEGLGRLDRVAWSASTVAISGFMAGDAGDAGDPAGAVAAGERCVVLAREVGDPGVLCRAVCGLSLVRQAQGRTSEAIDLMHEGLDLSEALGFRWGRGKFTYFLGWFAYLDGRFDQALQLLTTSVTTFVDLDERRSLADSFDAIGCVAARDGDPAAAVRPFAAAARLRAAAGTRRHAYLRGHAEKAESRATRHAGPAGVRAREQISLGSLRNSVAQALPGAAEPVVTQPFTGREAQVAELVAAGMTNRQIGRRLSISERTAERHVENLRGKLGVGTRAEIAAWFGAAHARTQPT